MEKKHWAVFTTPRSADHPPPGSLPALARILSQMAEGFWMPCGVQHSQARNSYGCPAWLACFLPWQEARRKQQESDRTAMLREVDWPIRDLEDAFYGYGFNLSQNSGPGSVFRLWSACSTVALAEAAARIWHRFVLGPAGSDCGQAAFSTACRRAHSSAQLQRGYETKRFCFPWQSCIWWNSPFSATLKGEGAL